MRYLMIILLLLTIGCSNDDYIVIDDTDLIEEKEPSEYVVIDDRDIADDDYRFVIKEVK